MDLNNYPKFQEFQGKSLLAVDYGTKVTGLASFCPGRDPFPMPFDRIINTGDEQVRKEILAVVENECIDVLILGLPFLTDGGETDQTRLVRSFGELLQKELSIPLHFQDETLSTFEAEERMKNDPRYNFKIDLKQIDALAASIILEDFIRS